MKQYDILKQIEQADENLLNDIIKAVMHRYNALHTDRFASILSLSTDPQTRETELEHFIRVSRSCPDRQQ